MARKMKITEYEKYKLEDVQYGKKTENHGKGETST